MQPISTLNLYDPQGNMLDFVIPITDKCERNTTLMGEEYVKICFNSTQRITIATLSYIIYNGQTYFIKETYRPTPKGTYYEYDCKFVSIANMLSKHICFRYMVIDKIPQLPEPEWTTNGTLETLYEVVIDSINGAADRLSTSHYKDMLLSIVNNRSFAQLLQDTKLKTISASGKSIADVLTTIANEYETEWWIDEDPQTHELKLNIIKCEHSDAIPLSDQWQATTDPLHPYTSQGLKSVEYASDWTDVPEKIIPFGSERNIKRKTGIMEQAMGGSTTAMTVSYGKRLRLTANKTYQVTDKQGNTKTILTDGNGALSSPNISTGIEVTQFYDDVYPQCHFRITKVSEVTLKIDDIDQPRYDVEAEPIGFTKQQLTDYEFYPLQIQEAETLSIVFESGLLNGREFEITNHTTKDAGLTTYSLKFRIKADGDAAEGTLLPSGNFKPNIGDEFALFNMVMPDIFIQNAENELAQKAYETLLDLENTRPQVKCNAEPKYFENINLTLGQRITITSDLFGDAPNNNYTSRVVSYSHSLTKPNEISFSLASAQISGVISEIIGAISDQTQDIKGLEQRTINLSRRAWQDAAEMANMLNSLVAEMMLIGESKYQFAYTFAINLVQNTTDQEQVTHFSYLDISAGQITHTQKPYIDYENKGVWDVNQQTISLDENGSTLDPTLPYYLYAICEQNQTTAQLILTTTQHSSDINNQTDQKYLLLGILSSEFLDGNTSFRTFNRTNGFTRVAGGTITTEIIQDPTSSLIIDFQSNPPRIIARNGAQLIGDFEFVLTDEQIQSAIGDFVDTEITNLTQTLSEQIETNISNITRQGNAIDNQAQTLKTLNEAIQQAKSDLEQAQSDLEQAKADVAAALQNLADMADDEKITPQEKLDLLREYYSIEAEFQEYVDKATAYGITKYISADLRQKYTPQFYVDISVIWFYKFSFFYSYGIDMIGQGGLKRYLVGTEGDNNTTGILGKNGQVDDEIMAQTTVINKADFKWYFDFYYIAKVELLNAITDYLTTINNETGNNLIGEENPLTLESYGVSYRFTALVGNFPNDNVKAVNQNFLLNGKTYTFCVDKTEVLAGSATAFNIGLYNETNNYRYQIPISTEQQRIVFTIPDDGTDYGLLLYDGIWGETAGNTIRFTNLALYQGSYAPNYYKAYIEHITNALKGTTDVKGGLLMTNVLMLKNENKQVTAGMSGLSGDKVLFWGGGTYLDALQAASGEIENADIQTLIRKDGQAKIGVFKIKEDKVLITTQNGNIVIDDNEGISIFDKDNILKILCTPKSISSYIPTDTIGEKELKALFGVSGNYHSLSSYLAPESQSASGTIPETSGYSFTLDEARNIVQIKFTGGSGSLNSYTSNGEAKDPISQINLTLYLESTNDNRSEYITLGTQITTLWAENLDPYTFTFTNIPKGTYKIKAMISCNPSGPSMIFYDMNLWFDLSYEGISGRTIIGNDGLVSIWSNKRMFAIRNDTNEQKTIIKGLPTSAGTTGSGQLYNDNGTIKVS